MFRSLVQHIERQKMSTSQTLSLFVNLEKALFSQAGMDSLDQPDMHLTKAAFRQ